MCTVITSNLVIGNLFIEAIRNENYEIKFKDVLNFEKELNNQLMESRSFSDIMIEDIYETVALFNDIFEIISETVRITAEKADLLLDKLFSYFRSGIPNYISDKFEGSYNKAFAN